MNQKFYTFLIIFICSIISSIFAQNYPPAVGYHGNNAIHKDSSIIIDWSSGVEIYRSYMNIENHNIGFATFGYPENTIGKADASVLSLGDGGYAVFNFNIDIVNGAGDDFVVFENGFFENDTSEFAFLELAFVEVSSDGIEFVRFPAVSELQTKIQIAGFGYINARYINNLAGKYTLFYGTPFNLDDIKNITAGTTVDINKITHIKIIDVIGNIDDNYASYDSRGNKINDPYPTEFESGGFDLDAVGVINNKNNSFFSKNEELKIYQNISSDKIYFEIKNDIIYEIIIYSANGSIAKHIKNPEDNNIDINEIKTGLYIIKFLGNKNSYFRKIIKL